MLIWSYLALKTGKIDLWTLTLRLLIITPFPANVPYYKFVDETISLHLSTRSARKDQFCLNIDLHEKTCFFETRRANWIEMFIAYESFFYVLYVICIFCHEIQKTSHRVQNKAILLILAFLNDCIEHFFRNFTGW